MLVVERVSANDARACGVINCADECGPAVNICSGIKSLLWNRAASALFTGFLGQRFLTRRKDYRRLFCLFHEVLENSLLVYIFISLKY